MSQVSAFIVCRGRCGLSKPREKFIDSSGKTRKVCMVCFRAELSLQARKQWDKVRRDPATQTRLLERITTKKKSGLASLHDYNWKFQQTPRSRMAALPPETREIAETLLRRYLAKRQHQVGGVNWHQKYAALCAVAVRWAKFKVANPGVNMGRVLRGKRRQRRRLLTMMGLRPAGPSMIDRLKAHYESGLIDYDTMTQEIARYEQAGKTSGT